MSFNPRSRKGNDGLLPATTEYKGVSIHVPARGTTRLEPAAGEKRLSFNPRSRKGNDEVRLRSFSVHSVSIHVPARGTTYFFQLTASQFLFQSTFPQGERLCGEFNRFSPSGFQSTFPQGERQMLTSYFIFASIVSIHVPARGTTSSRQKRNLRRRSFNPRSRKGNDRYVTFPFRWPSVSIHVPARGTTIVPVSPFQDPFVSIHVPARGTTKLRIAGFRD